MTRREKQRELFIELINYQLKDHGVTYEDVINMPAWYMEFKTTVEKEKEFIEYCVKRISKVLKISEEGARRETNWFILQWGLTTSTEPTKEDFKKKDKLRGKDSNI